MEGKVCNMMTGHLIPLFCIKWMMSSPLISPSYQGIPLPSGWAKTFFLCNCLFSSAKSLWHVRGAFLKKLQLRWPPSRNVPSEYPCAAALLAATSSGFPPVRLVEKSHFLLILLGKNASYMSHPSWSML